MKKSIFFPIVLLAIFIFIVSSACGFSFGKTGDETEVVEVTEAPQQEPQVIIITATPETPVVVATEAPTEVVATELPSTEAQPYFFDDFDGDTSNYSWEIFGPGQANEDQVEIEVDDGYLKMDLNGEQLYPWVFYDPYTYADVRIDVEVDNLATSDNSVQLICRYDEDLGWYEYDIENDGEWFLYYHDSVIAKDYIMLYDGGSTAINMGRDTNVYTMVCQGRELSLYINNVHIKTFEHKDLKEGYIAFGGSSYYSYPVKLNFNWLQVSEP